MTVVGLQLRLVQSNRPEQTFDLAWKPYPRKEAKKDGLKAWCDLNPDETLVQSILTAIAWQAHLWVVTEGRQQRHIPLFATYIRGDRWTDEQPKPTTPNRTIESLPQWQKNALMLHWKQ